MIVKSRVKTTVKNGEMVEKFLKNIKGAKKSYVTIGVHSDAGHYSEGKSPPEVYEVALWMEFGTKTVPERSFLRSTIDENGNLLRRWRDEMVLNILTKGWTLEKALTAMGFRIQILVQNKIKNRIAPELSQASLRRRKRDGLGTVPLVRTRLLLRSIGFKVHLEE